MSRKVPEIIFRAMAKDGEALFENKQDLHDYCIEHDGEHIMFHATPEALLSEKMKMYAYLHRVVYPCAVIGYTHFGWEGIDNVRVDYMLRAEFAKDFVKDPKGNYVPVVLDKSGMTKARLHKYLSDCIFFIENNFDQRVPGSEEYKMNKATGKNFKSVEG